jgi:hypothetical protein
LKVRGTNPLKNDQIVKKDIAPKMIPMTGKTSKQSKKRFRPVFRTSNRNKNNNKNSAAFIDTSQKTPSDADKLYSLVSSKGDTGESAKNSK